MPRTSEVCPTVCCLLLLLIIHYSSLITVHAQSATATLSGTVVDQNGAVVPDVNIAVISIAQGFQRSATSKEEGTFVVALLPPGKYTVKAERQGFTPSEVRDVVLNVNDQVAIKIHMKVGTVSQTVEIVDGASLINESPAVSTVVDRQFVANLPLNGRSFQSLITLTPGVVLTKASFGEQGQFSVNGQRAGANYFTVDGVSANIGISGGASLAQSAGGALPGLSATGGTNNLVSVDALQEFKLQTSTFAAEFGRTPGAQVQIVTRSGTNLFSGTLFEYFRNEALDANDWFANSRALPKPTLRQNDFGGVLGGPLYLPRFGEGGPAFISGKNRTFFFFSYEGLRLRLPQARTILVPSVAARQTAPPQIQPILNAYPIPNGNVFPNEFAEFSASYSDPSTLNATSIRLDHTPNERLTLFGRYNYSPSDSTTRGDGGVNALNSIRISRFKTNTLTVGSTQSVTSKVSNELRANYSKSEGENSIELDNFGGASRPSSLPLPPFATQQDAFLRFQFQTGGAAALIIGKNADNVQRQFNLVNNLSIISGDHQLKFGVDYRWLFPTNNLGAFRQTVAFAGLTGTTGASSGRASSITSITQEIVSLAINNFSAFGQDTWKITRRLSVSYGLRWEVNASPRGRNDKNLFTIQGLDNPSMLNLSALIFAPAGTPLYETTYNNFAPRVGVAYQLSQESGRETVLRGGFGVFYDLGVGSLGNAPAFFPFARTRSLLNVPYPLSTEQATPPPVSFSAPSGTIYVADPNLKLPRTYQFNVALEQSLGSDQTISASYVGAIGSRLLRQEFLVTPSFFFISLTGNAATSDYHAMQIQLQRRLSRGLQALTSYTYSHSIDIASNDSVPSTPDERFDPQIDRGSSDFDVRHAFNAGVTYNIPTPPIGRIGRIILRNFSVDTIVTARSATPIDLIGTTNFAGGFFALLRPDVIPGIPLYLDDPLAPVGRRINRAAFAPPQAGRQGTLGRNSLRGFPVWQVDVSLRRQFNLTERTNLQFRAEFFNIFNHPNFADPVNDLSSPLFGRSTQMLGRSLGSGGANGGFNPLYQVGGPRSIQLAIKLNF